MIPHTPGPWRLQRDTFGVWRIWAHDEDGDQDVGSSTSDGGVPREEEEANGLLMAAAPELLSALRCLYLAVALDETNAGQLGIRSEYDAANLAIMKAEGRS